jgi:HAD superfamily hydrolase (TIGR01549 family)
MSTQPRYRHLFWEFDGTLYDSYGQLTHAMLCALNDLGRFAPPSQVYELLKQSVSYASHALAERFSLPVKALREAFYKHQDAISGFPLSRGADACLHTLKRLGCKHYLYTHRGRSAIRQLEDDGLAHLFTGYVTREDGFPRKPAPDALLAMMDRHLVLPQDAVMIGDRELDILAGHNAGVKGILFDPKGFYPDLAVEYRAGSMAEITAGVRG